MKICILLATYNGEKYLPEMIRSVEEQTALIYKFYVRDDCSQDNTLKILNELKGGSLSFIHLSSAPENVGSVNVFFGLSMIAYEENEQYFFLADQDDIWEKNKVAVFSDRMLSAELVNRDVSILIFSNMSVVDEGGGIISPSFMSYQGLSYEPSVALNVLLAQNFITGCASMLNRELMRVSLPFPKEAIIHDWWVALCAAAMGHIEYIDEPLVKYRQHANNQIGASHWSSHLNPFKSNWHQRWLSGRDNLKASMLQARALAERVKLHYPNNENIPLIEAYADLINVKSGVERVRRARALGVRVQTPLRYGLFLSRLLFLNGK